MMISTINVDIRILIKYESLQKNKELLVGIAVNT
jgi:hypothetical protein